MLSRVYSADFPPPELASTALYNMLSSTPGLNVPSDERTINFLRSPDLDTFLRHGAIADSHYLPNARGRMTRLIQLIHAWCDHKTADELLDTTYLDPPPLSAHTWQRFEGDLHHPSYGPEQCKHTSTLDQLVRLLLNARRDWLVEDLENRLGEMPDEKLTAKIHCCLLTLRKREMLGLRIEKRRGTLSWILLRAMGRFMTR